MIDIAKAVIAGIIAMFTGLFSAVMNGEQLSPVVSESVQIEQPVTLASTSSLPSRALEMNQGIVPTHPETSAQSPQTALMPAPTSSKRPVSDNIASLTSTTTTKLPGALIAGDTEPVPTHDLFSNTNTTTFELGSMTQAAVLQLTNLERNKFNLSTLNKNEQLTAIAYTKANDMIQRGYFAHVAPDGTDIEALAKRFEYAYLNIGENLALGDFATSGEVVSGWMDSPGHRANILAPFYTEIGIAVVRGTHEGRAVWFAVQEFGRPQSACPRPSKILEQKITLYEDQLSKLDVALDEMRNELNQQVTSESDYRRKIEDYNTAVEMYNSLIAEMKIDVANYNASVATHNACVDNPK